MLMRRFESWKAKESRDRYTSLLWPAKVQIKDLLWLSCVSCDFWLYWKLPLSFPCIHNLRARPGMQLPTNPWFLEICSVRSPRILFRANSHFCWFCRSEPLRLGDSLSLNSGWFTSGSKHMVSLPDPDGVDSGCVRLNILICMFY